MKNQKLRIGAAVLFGISAVLAVVFVVLLLRLNMVPMKFFIPVAVVLLLMLGALGICLLARPGKYESDGKIRSKIVAMVLSCVLSLCLGLGIGAVSKALKTMNALGEKPSQITNMVDVYVNRADPAQSVGDTRDYIFGYCAASGEDYPRLALDQIEKELGKRPETRTFDTETQMADALFDGRIGAVIMHENVFHVMTGLDGYQDFAEKTRLLVQYSADALPTEPPVNTVPVTTAPPETTEPAHQDDTLLMYLSGTDIRGDIRKYKGRSDVNIIMAVNTSTKEILLVNTPRDYYVPNHAYGDRKDKLTHCAINGVENSLYALHELYGLDIPYYAQINFTGFERLIDALGGVCIYSPKSFVTSGGVPIQYGSNYLNGSQALAYARERHAFASGDIARGNHQMDVIKALIDQVGASDILKNYFEILDSLEGVLATNLPQSRIAELVKLQLSERPQWKIHTFAVSGRGNSKPTATAPGMSLYVMMPDEKLLAQGAELIEKVLNGVPIYEQDLKTE